MFFGEKLASTCNAKHLYTKTYKEDLYLGESCWLARSLAEKYLFLFYVFNPCCCFFLHPRRTRCSGTTTTTQRAQ